MRVGQQHAAAIERAIAADRHGIAAAIQSEALQARVRQLIGPGIAAELRRGLRRRRASQGFGELPDTALDQQAPSEFDQIFGADITHPLTLALLRQALLAAFGEITVIARGITFHQVVHLRRLRVPEGFHRCGSVEPGEEQVADAILALFDGELLRPEITRALAIDRDDLVGQQAQVVLRVGVTNAETQSAFIFRADVRHTKGGAADIGTGLCSGTERMGGQT